MKKRLFAILFMTFSLVFSCTRENVIPDADEPPRLKSITVKAYSLDLPPGEKAFLQFTLRDKDFVFETNPYSSSFPIEICLEDGSVADFCEIVSLTRESGTAEYNMCLKNNGRRESFNERVHLSFVSGKGSGKESRVDSESFLLICTGKELLVDTGLPVVVVNTENNQAITSKETYVNAQVYIQGTGKYQDLPLASARIRGRGNTTWTWPKKPYLIAFDKRQSVFGMPEHKRWVLLANFMDRTLMRNMIAMHVSSMTSLEWTPGCVPVELVLNGVHKGTYLLIEQVRVDENRVNITDGYLYELDFHYDNEFQWYDHNIPFSVKYPDPEDLTQEQKAEAKEYISATANAIYGSNFTDETYGYAKYIDVDSFIDYWIVFEVMCNHELGNPGSVFFHKSKGGKLIAGPCWDFDWGVLTFITGGDYRLVNGNAIWYSRLFQDPAFKAKVKARYQQLKPQLLSVPDYIDECAKLLEKSAELNFKMWNPADDKSQNGGKIINGDENMTFSQAVQRLKSNFNKHLSVIDSKL